MTLKRLSLLIVSLYFLQPGNAQTQTIFSKFSKSAFTVQFAGSIGFLSAGYSRVTEKDKIEISLLYGQVPRYLGGVTRTLTLKGIYNPFKFQQGKLKVEPLQAGVFAAQHFGDYLGLSWGSKYPPGYYWWTRSLRLHLCLSSQLSVQLNKKRLDRLSLYFEANTNDLYLYSYFSNMKSLSFYDIVFFGAGCKLYLNKKEKLK